MKNPSIAKLAKAAGSPMKQDPTKIGTKESLVKPKKISFDPTPVVPKPMLIFDPLADEQQQKFNNLLKEVEAEKTKVQTQGLAGLLGGKKAYV